MSRSAAAGCWAAPEQAGAPAPPPMAPLLPKRTLLRRAAHALQGAVAGLDAESLRQLKLKQVGCWGACNGCGVCRPRPRQRCIQQAAALVRAPASTYPSPVPAIRLQQLAAGPPARAVRPANPQPSLAPLPPLQGRPHALCDLRIVDDAGRELPWDGKAFGNLQARTSHAGSLPQRCRRRPGSALVALHARCRCSFFIACLGPPPASCSPTNHRPPAAPLPPAWQVHGPATLSRYYKAAEPATDAGGWFDTGDVATIDALGHMQAGRRAGACWGGARWRLGRRSPGPAGQPHRAGGRHANPQQAGHAPCQARRSQTGRRT